MENCSGILPHMAQYELTFILPTELTPAKEKSLLAKLTNFVEKEGGKIVKDKENMWGKRPLAYPIKKRSEGVYFLWELELPTQKVAQVNRMLEVEEDVLRHLLVRG